jgi:hypothetical protein
MRKEMPVIPVYKVVDPKRTIKKWRTEEEERHKGSLAQKTLCRTLSYGTVRHENSVLFK